MSTENKFQILERNVQGVICLDLHGYLDAHTAPDLENKIEELFESGNNKILMNLSKLDYISSAGLGVFMAFIEEIRSSGGDIKLSNLQSKVFSVFDLLGFPMLFDIEQDEEKALIKFANGNMKSDE